MIALVITLLKALIGFVGFLAVAIKIMIVLAFCLYARLRRRVYGAARSWQEQKSRPKIKLLI